MTGDDINRGERKEGEQNDHYDIKINRIIRVRRLLFVR